MELKLIFSILMVLCVSTIASDNSNLLSVVVLFRHGDRTPTKFAPLDPYQDTKYWPAGLGELTNVGIQQHYNLGKWLRQQYKDFLSSEYVKGDIYVRSDDSDRCLMSAAANLAGLYPPTGDQVWNLNLLWRPIPIHTLPKKEDHILEMSELCQRYIKVYSDVLNTDEFKEIDAKNANIYAYLNKNLGVNITSFADIYQWYDTLKVEEVHNLTLPNWTHLVYPYPMKNWTELAFRVPTYTPELSRFATGPFFDTISSHFEAVRTNTTKDLLAKKLVLFSGHQTNICDITNTLKVFRSGPYASALIFELRKDTKTSKPFVKLLYKTNEDLEALTMKNCSIECDLTEFLQIVEPLRLKDSQVEKECMNTDKN